MYEKIQFEREIIDVVQDFLRSFMQFQHHNITNFGINLKKVIDRFIWTIELCHICNFAKHFFNPTLFLKTTNAMISENYNLNVK
jgi:hypothetical protein